MLDKNTQTYQEHIAKLFGYEDSFVDDYFESTYLNKNKQKPKNNDTDIIEDNKGLKCICCGKILKKGLYGKDLLKGNKIFSVNFTETYSLANPKNKDNVKFICGACLYSLKNYGGGKGLNMQNLLIFKKEYKRINIQSNKDNEMYEYLLGDFKEPYIMLINSRGKVLEFITHFAVPTVSDDIRVIVFGTKVMYIEKKLLKECLEDTIKLIKELNISKNLLLNTKADESRFIYFASKKNLSNKEFIPKMGEYHAKYDKDTRLITGKLLEKYIKENKK